MLCLFFWALLFSLSPPLFSKVDPPNYDFSLDTLEVFEPGKTVKEVEQNFQGKVLNKSGPVTLKRYYVAHIRYKFPVMVQFKEGKVIDFFARLPSYFLHDVFHQSLINRYELQDQYTKKEAQAVYIWKEDKVRRIYQGQCTITCFPMYYVVKKMDEKTPSILEKMQKRWAPKK